MIIAHSMLCRSIFHQKLTSVTYKSSDVVTQCQITEIAVIFEGDKLTVVVYDCHESALPLNQDGPISGMQIEIELFSALCGGVICDENTSTHPWDIRRQLHA